MATFIVKQYSDIIEKGQAKWIAKNDVPNDTNMAALIPLKNYAEPIKKDLGKYYHTYHDVVICEHKKNKIVVGYDSIELDKIISDVSLRKPGFDVNYEIVAISDFTRHNHFATIKLYLKPHIEPKSKKTKVPKVTKKTEISDDCIWCGRHKVCEYKDVTLEILNDYAMSVGNDIVRFNYNNKLYAMAYAQYETKTYNYDLTTTGEKRTQKIFKGYDIV